MWKSIVAKLIKATVKELKQPASVSKTAIKQDKRINLNDIVKIVESSLLVDDEINNFDYRLSASLETHWQVTKKFEHTEEQNRFLCSCFIRSAIVLKYLIRKDLAQQFLGLEDYDDIHDLVDVIVLDQAPLITRYFERQIAQLGLTPLFASLPLACYSYRSHEDEGNDMLHQTISDDLAMATEWLVTYEFDFEESQPEN